ncbi:MAG: 7TM-DISM domain-containing protein, partial [Glaciecola sp.]
MQKDRIELKALFAQCLFIGLLLALNALPIMAFSQESLLERSNTDMNAVDVKDISASINLQTIVALQYTGEGLLLSDVVQLTEWQRQFSFTPIPENNVLWVRFQIQNSSSSNIPLILIAGNTFIDRVDGFLLDDQGRIIQSIQRNNTSPNVDTSGLHGFRMAITSRPDQLLNVYLRIDDDGSAILPIELWDEQKFEQQSNVRLILLGALCGGLSLLATYFLITYMLKNAPARFWFAIFAVASMTTLL